MAWTLLWSAGSDIVRRVDLVDLFSGVSVWWPNGPRYTVQTFPVALHAPSLTSPTTLSGQISVTHMRETWADPLWKLTRLWPCHGGERRVTPFWERECLIEVTGSVDRVPSGAAVVNVGQISRVVFLFCLLLFFSPFLSLSGIGNRETKLWIYILSHFSSVIITAVSNTKERVKLKMGVPIFIVLDTCNIAIDGCVFSCTDLVNPDTILKASSSLTLKSLSSYTHLY